MTDPSKPSGETNRVENDPGDGTWSSPRGRLVISYPAPAVILFSYYGYMTADVVPFVDQEVGRVLATGAHPDLFVDLGRLDGYDSDYRRSITRWGVRNRRHFGDYWFFVRSRLVAIGVAVSNLAAGGTLKATTKRAEFDAAIRAAVRRQMGHEWTHDRDSGAGPGGL